MYGLAKHVDSMPLSDKQLCRLAIKRYKDVAPQPSPLIGDDAIGEIAARRQHCQSRFDSGTIDLDFFSFDEPPIGAAMSDRATP